MNKKYLMFVLLIAVFAAPILGSQLLFFYRDHFHFKTLNYGHLINPPVNVRGLIQADGKTQQWVLLLVNEGDCKADCMKQLHLINQIKKALGSDQQRLSTVLLDKENNIEKFKQAVSPVLNSSVSSFNVSDKFYLIDPQGNLFMYYLAGENPMGILKDIKHLFRNLKSA